MAEKGGTVVEVASSKDATSHEAWSESEVPDSTMTQAYLLLEDPSSSGGAYAFAMTQLLLIIVSIVALVLETIPMDQWGDSAPSNLGVVFEKMEMITTLCFTLELLARFVVAPIGGETRCSFLLRVANIFDFLAIMPWYLEMLLTMLDVDGGATQGFRVLRIIRLPRVFKIFKLGKYSEGLVLIIEGLKRSFSALQLMVFLMVVGMVIFASLMYLVEKETQCYGQYVFATIPDACWFVFVTFTTAGYGDAFPKTATGQAIAVLTMFSGIVLLAMPISIIGQKFTEVYSEIERAQVDKELEISKLMVYGDNIEKLVSEASSLATEMEQANAAVLAEILSLAAEITSAAPGCEEVHREAQRIQGMMN